eukprot:scaffold34883_cov57-Phaeocystis_antarctica.AAC.1
MAWVVGGSGGVGSPSVAPSPSIPAANTLRLLTRARPSMVYLCSSPSGKGESDGGLGLRLISSPRSLCSLPARLSYVVLRPIPVSSGAGAGSRT